MEAGCIPGALASWLYKVRLLESAEVGALVAPGEECYHEERQPCTVVRLSLTMAALLRSAVP